MSGTTNYPAPPIDPYGDVQLQQRTSPLAVVSLVTSLIGVHLAGIITGHIALSQIRRTGERGRGLAIAGVVIGYVGIVVVLVIGLLSAVAVPIFLAQQNAAKDASTKSDLYNLKVAVVSYGVANLGQYPTDNDLKSGALAAYGFDVSPSTREIGIIRADDVDLCLRASSTTGDTFYLTYGDVSMTPCG
jgi:hypothetical protein